MMKTRFVSVLVTLFILGVLCSAPCQPEAYGLPLRLANLTNLRQLLDKKELTARQRTEVLIAWLTEERRQPSPTTSGLGGGDIDSGYIQAQIMKAMGEVGDPLVLRELAANAEVDPPMRDAASLALGRMYDTAQIPGLLVILERSAEPDFRALAAASLGAMGAVEAQPALERALQDEFTRRAGNCTKGVYMAYPVREAAQVALRVLEISDPELLKYRKERIEAFTRRLQTAEAARQITGK